MRATASAIGKDAARAWKRLPWCIAALCLSCCTALAVRQQSTPNPRPNVLFIAVDDLRPELGCYGAAHAESPCLDRLAASSAVFTRHYVQVPTCGASRYALLTGRSPRHSGALGNEVFFRGPTRIGAEPRSAAATLPELFRRSGYHTVQIGKVSHTPDGRVLGYDGSGDGQPELPHAWDELLPAEYGPWERGWGQFFAYAGGAHREDGGGHRALCQFTVEGDDDLPDGRLARSAAHKLRELAEGARTGTPFFLALGLFKPHLPFVATRADLTALEARPIPLPERLTRGLSAHAHTSAELRRYASGFTGALPSTPSEILSVKRAYLACVRYTDRQIGRVLAALEAEGLADSTIVIVWGDHGWHLGEAGLWGKHTPFERALHSPLILRAPGVTEPGSRYAALVESLDLFPTLVELCAPSFRATVHPLDGVSLLPLLRGEVADVREAALSYWQRSVSVRTSEYRLIADLEGAAPPELYASTDPDAAQDLARERTDIVARLLRIIPAARD